MHFGSIFGCVFAPKSTSEVLGLEKVDLQKPLFLLRDIILFDLGGRPGPPKIAPGSASTCNAISNEFRVESEPEMEPKMLPFGALFEFF